MKKIIFALFCFTFLYGETPQDAKNTTQNKESTLQTSDASKNTLSVKEAEIMPMKLNQFFAKVGLGPIITRGSKDPFFSFTLSAGILMPATNNFKHLLSLDLDVTLLSNWFASLEGAPPRSDPIYRSINSSGTDLLITLNYGLDIPLFFERTRFIPALGLGLERASLELEIGGVKTSDSAFAFVITPSLTLRQFLAEKAALDFTYKTDFLTAGRGGTASFSRHAFLFSFAYLF